MSDILFVGLVLGFLIFSLVFIMTTPARQPQQEYIRPEVMAFAHAMEEVLRTHDGKKTHWRDVSVSFGYLFGRISEEIKEAKGEYDSRHPDYHRCVMELVDVANFCMMCYDRIHPADTRPHTSPPAPVAERQPCKYMAGEHCDTCFDATCGFYPFKKHDAQVAKAAREDVLDEATEWLFGQFKQFTNEKYTFGDDWLVDWWIERVGYLRTLEGRAELESLRAQQAGEP